jgi:hypothetical protein
MSEREPVAVTNLDRYDNQALLWDRTCDALRGTPSSNYRSKLS